MSSNYKINDQHIRYFLTMTIVDWVDLFSRENYRQIVIDSLRHCIRKKGLVLYAYVVMTNHIHLIVSSPDRHLSATLRDFKSFTARMILDAITADPESRRSWILERFAKAAKNSARARYQVWYHRNHAVPLYTPDFTRQKCHYIHHNPVRAGFVARAGDWLYSSAINYEGASGLIEVTLLEEMYFIE